MDRAALAAYIDQTLLSPTAGFAEASAWLERNAQLGFAALCVSPFLVPLAAQRLAGTTTRICSVCAFPLGYQATETKVAEAIQLVGLGCVEVDVVMNVAAFLEGEDRFVVDDLRAVVEAVDDASDGEAVVKVIIETGRLDAAGVARASRLVSESGAAFVKTSTGFGPRGASVEDVRIMREAVGDRLGVKAAGGIRDLETALSLIDAGALRIGTSVGDAIRLELPA